MRRIAIALALVVTVVAGLLGAVPASAAGTGAILGHVYGAGSPNVAMDSVPVVVYNAAGDFQLQTYTGIAGEYTLAGLPPGDYRIFFSSGFGNLWVSEWYLDSPTRAGSVLTTVAGGEQVIRDAVLPRGGILHGTITGADHPGVGLDGAEVWVSDAAGDYVMSAAALANGTYVTGGIAPGSYYVEFRESPADSVHTPEWWNGAPSRATATPITVVAGGDLLLSADLPVGASISGSVFTSLAEIATFPGVGLQIFDTATMTTVYDNGAPGGQFTVTGLAPGTYTIFMIPPSLYAPVWYGEHASLASASTITVVLGETVTGADMHGVVAVTAYGSATDEDSQHVVGSAVAYEAGYGGATTATLASHATFSAGSTYQVEGLIPGASYVFAYSTDPLGYVPATGAPVPANGYLSLFNGAAPSYVTAPPVTPTEPTSLPAVLYAPKFADVTDPRSTFWPYIRWMSTQNISTGTPQPSGLPLYNPAAPVSRQAMASFLFKLSGDVFAAPETPTFADVPSSSQFYAQIEWMASRGISLGTPQPSGKPLFSPSVAVSRQTMAVFLSRYAGAALPAPTVQSFADVPIDAASAAAIEWMKTQGISTGTAQPSGLPLYKPAEPVSRQAMAAFLYRLSNS